MTNQLDEISNLNYRGWTYKKAFLQMLNEAYDEGIISNNKDFPSYIESRQDIESELVMLYSIIAETLFDKDTGCINLLEQNYNSHILNRATGVDLDVLGEYFGLYRIPATYSCTDLTITINTPLDYDLTIPRGTRFTNTNGDIVFSTREQVTLPKGNTIITANAISSISSYSGRVSAGEITVGLDQVGGVTLHSYNQTASVGGLPEETDDEFRTRISNWAYSLPRTTLSSYRNYLRSLDGLKGYNLVPRWNGTGTLKIIVSPSSDYIINSIMDYVDTSICNIDDDVTVVGATEKNLHLSIILNVDIDQVIPYTTSQKEIIRQKVQTALYIYVNGGYLNDGSWWDGFSIGEDFIPSKCSYFLQQQVSELKNITFITPGSQYTDGSHNYAILDSEVVTVGNDEICVLSEDNIEIKVE